MEGKRKQMEKELMEEGYKKHELDQLNFRRLTDFYESQRHIKQMIVISTPPKDTICPKCGEKQWSVMDRNYVELFKICWHCDRMKWINGKLSLEKFERREKLANQSN